MDRRKYPCERLIDDIYDAGASPDRWPAVLSSIASAVGAEGGVMFGFSRSRGLVLEHNGSLDPASAVIFKSRHMDNAWVRGMAEKPCDQLVLSDQLIRLRELKRSAFYDEVLHPQRIAHGALCTVTAGADVSIQFSVHKTLTRGLFNSTEVLALRRLLPHVRRALGVSLRLTPAAGPDTDSIADRLACAAFTLSRQGALLDVNLNAHRLAGNYGSFSFSSAGVCFRDSYEHRRMLEAIKRVLDGASLQSVVLTDEAHRFEVIVAGLKASNAQRPSSVSARAPAVIVFINDLRHYCRPMDLQRMDEKLTVAESRVAKMAALGISSSAIARTLELSLNTVKTHLRRIYQKLDVHRQGELVALLGVPSPYRVTTRS